MDKLEIQKILVNEMLGVQSNQTLENKGYVLSVGDGIARVYGLTRSTIRRISKIFMWIVWNGFKFRNRKCRYRYIW